MIKTPIQKALAVIERLGGCGANFVFAENGKASRELLRFTTAELQQIIDSHEELLGALKLLESRVGPDIDSTYYGPEENADRKAIKAARAAIAKAEGK